MQAKKVEAVAEAVGMLCVVGTEIEPGFSLAAKLHLAASMKNLPVACEFTELSLLQESILRQQVEIEDGFVKVLLNPETRDILGCHILGSDASTLIHEVIISIKAGLGAAGITKAIHIHPALSEVVQRAFGNVKY